jgi:hypothetical protein
MATIYLFLDLKANNDAEILRINGRISDLTAAQASRGLGPDELAELALLQKLLPLSTSEPVDPMFVATRDLFNFNLQVPIPNFDVSSGALQILDASGSLIPALIRCVGAYGLLEADQIQPPATTTPPAIMSQLGNNVGVNPNDPQYPSFNRSFYAAVGEFDSVAPLADLVFPILAEEGNQNGTGSMEVRAVEFAKVLRYLFKKGITVSEPQLRRRVNEALDSIQSVGAELPPSDITIDLPDLSETQDTSLVSTNIRGLMPIYFSAMFDQLKVFDVVDKLVELFQNGVLPVGLGDAGNYLYKYWKETPTRISDSERRDFYSRCFGFPGGRTDTNPNREFNDLWLRFISAVSSYVRQVNVDNLLRAAYPGAVSQQQVRKSAYDLALNLTVHGYGMTYFAATELQQQIKDVIKLLSSPDMLRVYAATDMWQLIDQVASLELPGGPANSVRYRTMATSTAVIMAWLANNTRRLVTSSYDPILNPVLLTNPIPRANGTSATSNPTDADLVNACEQWLAVNGTQEPQVEQYAQASESPVMPSAPIRIPSIAKDALEAAGVSMGLGLRQAARVPRN